VLSDEKEWLKPASPCAGEEDDSREGLCPTVAANRKCR
jgi:hypothetical protein